MDVLSRPVWDYLELIFIQKFNCSALLSFLSSFIFGSIKWPRLSFVHPIRLFDKIDSRVTALCSRLLSPFKMLIAPFLRVDKDGKFLLLSCIREWNSIVFIWLFFSFFFLQQCTTVSRCLSAQAITATRAPNAFVSFSMEYSVSLIVNRMFLSSTKMLFFNQN